MKLILITAWIRRGGVSDPFDEHERRHVSEQKDEEQQLWQKLENYIRVLLEMAATEKSHKTMKRANQKREKNVTLKFATLESKEKYFFFLMICWIFKIILIFRTHKLSGSRSFHRRNLN